ncbi:MAG TPA: NAD(P)/FAD-dependent oxidoreductase, partial [Acholeplasmataceae bacterium]|nr:NAD(P)/FAD-dependent oxidoreductase [Acholeplasmataceae bacterium]
MNKVYDAIIIGGGPAGLMAANALHERNIDYLLLEKNDQLAKKLLLTGGKRCNITNNLSVPAFIESLNMKHKKFLYPALSNFNSQDILNFFKIRGLTFSLEQDIKYFPDTGKSQSVRDALLKTIDLNCILYQQSVKSLTYEHDHWVIKTQSDTYDARNVLVATGSKAYPTTGSSGDGFMFAERLGIMLEPLYPAETHVYADVVK